MIMPLITETYYLSLTQDNRGILRLRCSQDDTLRTVNLKLYNNGSVFVIPSGISASVSGVKQNGAVFSKQCTISQNRESVVLQLSSDITNVDGIIVAEIVLNDGEGGRLGTSNFIIQVEKNPMRAGIIQDTETPIEYVNDFITQIQALTARVNNLITPNGDPSLAEVVDARISSLDGNTYQNLKARIDADIATLNTGKANKSEVYTKSQVDNLLENVEIDVDDELSDESENPVQNKVINRTISEIKANLEESEPLTEDIKVALLNVASHIGLWSDGDGKKYYDTLEAALYPYTGLVRISAVFTQGSAVIYPSTPLNDLKAYLVVTGYYNDGTSKIITDYALSGTLTTGTSTVTVRKRGNTATFTVTVSAPYWDYEWYASSGIAPLDINGNPAYGLFVDGLFKLDESHPEFAYAESLPVEVAIEFVSIVKVNSIPMFSFCYNYDSDGGDGFKIYNNSDGKVQTSVSGSSIATETDFHVGSELQSIHAIVASTGCSFEFGDISGSGTGVFNNQWLLGNNIAYPRLNTGGDIRLKSIKFKYLT